MQGDYFRAGSHGLLLRIRFYSVKKVGQCEHSNGGLLTLGFVNFDKRLKKPIYSILEIGYLKTDCANQPLVKLKETIEGTDSCKL